MFLVALQGAVGALPDAVALSGVVVHVVGVEDVEDDEDLIVDDLRLWDDREGTVAAGVSYEEGESS